MTLPDAAYAGSENATTPPTPDAAASSEAPPVDAAAGAPAAGEAPSESNLATALDATSGKPGNTVLNDVVNTPPGPERGSTISDDAREIAPTPPVPDTAPIPDVAKGHLPG